MHKNTSKLKNEEQIINVIKSATTPKVNLLQAGLSPI